MPRLDDIRGQPVAVELLRGLLDRERVPHAMLFHGPEAVGKATAARALAAALLCNAEESPPCGTCASCVMLGRGNHPDLLEVGRLLKKDEATDRLAPGRSDVVEADLRSQILIDQIRRLTSLAALAPRSGRRRVFVIDPADRMNREAQNALLKTLEEPPEHSVLILVSARWHLLLPTVRSRCFAVGFSAMRTADLAEILETRGIARDEAAARAALAGGRFGEALRLDVDSRRARRWEVLEMLQALADGPAAVERLPAMASALAGKDEPTLVDGLDLAEELLRDAALAAFRGDERGLFHADLNTELRRLGHALGPGRAAELVTAIERVRGYLRFNANRTLIAQTLLAALAGGPVP